MPSPEQAFATRRRWSGVRSKRSMATLGRPHKPSVQSGQHHQSCGARGALAARAVAMVGAMVDSRKAVVALFVGIAVHILGSATLPGQQPLTVSEALDLRMVANPQLGEGFVAFNVIVPRPIADGPGGSYLHLGVIEKPEYAQEGKFAAVRWLVSGKNSAGNLAIVPGQRAVSYTRRIDGVHQIVVQAIDGGEAKVYAETPSVSS